MVAESQLESMPETKEKKKKKKDKERVNKLYWILWRLKGRNSTCV